MEGQYYMLNYIMFKYILATIKTVFILMLKMWFAFLFFMYLMASLGHYNFT
jgi:hypothetical protein